MEVFVNGSRQKRKKRISCVYVSVYFVYCGVRGVVTLCLILFFSVNTLLRRIVEIYSSNEIQGVEEIRHLQDDITGLVHDNNIAKDSVRFIKSKFIYIKDLLSL